MAPDDVRGGLVDAAPGRRVARVEITLTGQRALGDQVEILRRVKGLQFFARGRARFHDAHALVEPARGELGEKSGMAVRTERMAVAEAVTRQAFAGDQQNRWASTDDAAVDSVPLPFVRLTKRGQT